MKTISTPVVLGAIAGFLGLIGLLGIVVAFTRRVSHQPTRTTYPTSLAEALLALPQPSTVPVGARHDIWGTPAVGRTASARFTYDWFLFLALWGLSVLSLGEGTSAHRALLIALLTVGGATLGTALWRGRGVLAAAPRTRGRTDAHLWMAVFAGGTLLPLVVALQTHGATAVIALFTFSGLAAVGVAAAYLGDD